MSTAELEHGYLLKLAFTLSAVEQVIRAYDQLVADLNLCELKPSPLALEISEHKRTILELLPPERRLVR